MYNAILVDDEPRTLEALASKVDWKKNGIFQVHKALSMEDAIEIITKSKVDILICDIEMPNGSGLQLLEWLRERRYEINCIFVTCHPEFDYMRKAIQLKCYDYILKPINYEDFTRVLNDLVKKMEAWATGADNIEAVNWGGLTDSAILEQGKISKERNVEMEVKKYVREHMMETITVSDIAKELHFNPQYLMRSFKGKTGLSIMEYITKARMETAKKVLKDTNLPIKEVANIIGYEDYAYFTRVFKKECNISPTQYRLENKKVSLLSNT